jgi:hypothetical protein
MRLKPIRTPYFRFSEKVVFFTKTLKIPQKDHFSAKGDKPTFLYSIILEKRHKSPYEKLNDFR